MTTPKKRGRRPSFADLLAALKLAALELDRLREPDAPMSDVEKEVAAVIRGAES